MLLQNRQNLIKILTANTVDFSYILKNYASVSDSSVTISESDIQKLIMQNIKRIIRELH